MLGCAGGAMVTHATSHYMQLPREVIIGRNVAALIGKTLRRLGFNGPVMIVTGPKSFSVAGATVLSSLKKAGFRSSVVTVVSATSSEVAKVKAQIRHQSSEVVIGLGGGKDIDVAKLGSRSSGLSFVSVPTAASHDGIASPLCSMKDPGSPHSSMVHAPIAIIADTEIIARSPYRLIASGCGDVIAKYTAVRDWRLAHRIKNEYYGDYAADLALMSFRLVVWNARNIKNMDESGVRTLVEALVSCGVAMSIAGTSRPCSGAEHLFSHALSMISPKPALHGEQCGVGTIMCAYLHGANWRMIKRVLQEIGAPTTANELGVDPEHLVEALTGAHNLRPERYTILGSGATREVAFRAASVTGVI
jgi:glycerol-1-phosphate dehydrogenase [NAD(P)+]